MKVQLGTIAALLILSATTASSATDTTPAWQEPGFIMEEVVVTATAEDVAAAARELPYAPAPTFVAASAPSRQLQ